MHRLNVWCSVMPMSWKFEFIGAAMGFPTVAFALCIELRMCLGSGAFLLLTIPVLVRRMR